MSVAYLLAFAAAAAADQPIDKFAVEIMHSYGRCVARRDPRRARELLAMDYQTEDYSKALRRLADRNSSCVPSAGRLKFNSVLFAGALAEALIKSETKGADLTQRITIDPQKVAVPLRSELDDMALCTIAESPAESAHLIATKPMSPEESQAIRALAPALTQCLRKGMTVTFNRPALRSVMALTAWRIVTTPRSAQP